MSFPIDTDKLRQEFSLRGWDQVMAAKETGVPQSTLSKAMRRGVINAMTLRKLSEALEAHPPLAGAASILRDAS